MVAMPTTAIAWEWSEAMRWKLVIDPLFGIRLAEEPAFQLLSLPEHFPFPGFRISDDVVALIVRHSPHLPDGSLISVTSTSVGIYPSFVPSPGFEFTCFTRDGFTIVVAVYRLDTGRETI